MHPHDLAEVLVELIDRVTFTHALAVRRVADHAAVLAVFVELGEEFAFEVDVGPDPGVTGVFAGQADHLRVHVGRDDRHLQRLLPQVAGFLASLGPELDRHLRPRLGDEGAVASRRHVAGDEGRFNRDRAAAAERVDQDAVAVPVAELDQGGGEGLLERSIGGHLAVAALVQALARGVDGKQRPVVE